MAIIDVDDPAWPRPATGPEQGYPSAVPRRQGATSRARSVVAVMCLMALLAAGCSDGGASESVAEATRSADDMPVLTTTTAVETATSPAPSTSTTTSVAAPTTTVAELPTPAQCLADAPIDALVGQLVLATITEGGIAELSPDVVDGTIGGIVLLGDADSRIAEVIEPLYAAEIEPIVGVDEEGGDVQRLAQVLGYLPSARRLGDRGNVDSTFFAGAKRGTGAAALGFNMVFAPVLDVGRSAGLRSRSYGDDVDVVEAHGLAYALGLEAGGVVPVAKHFPGHGSTGADSHLGLPTTDPLADLMTSDLLPFAMAANGPEAMDAIMIGHLVVPDLTDGLPASLSSAAVAMLRDGYGFDGLIVSDDLTMGALSKWTIPEAAELALGAGDDLLIAGGFRDALATTARLIEAVDSGRVSRERVEQAASRVLAIKNADPCVIWGH